MTTICAECRWLSDTAKGKTRWNWRCNAVPVEPEVDIITGELTAPYARCVDINRGECSEFEAGHNCVRPAEGGK